MYRFMFYSSLICLAIVCMLPAWMVQAALLDKMHQRQSNPQRHPDLMLANGYRFP